MFIKRELFYCILTGSEAGTFTSNFVFSVKNLVRLDSSLFDCKRSPRN